MRPATALLLAALALGGCDRKKAAEPQPQPSAAPAAPTLAAGPDFSHKGKAEPTTPFQRADGGPASLAGFRGKPLLVNLWATWCGPCVREMPTLQELAAANSGRFRFIAVSQDLNGKAAVAPFLARHGWSGLPVYLDTRNVLLTGIGADNLPTTILYDARGRERWRVNGDMDWSSAAAKALIDKGLAG